MVLHENEGHAAEAKGLVEDESQRKERRRVDKFITLQVQQIFAAQQQARHPSHMCRLLSQSWSSCVGHIVAILNAAPCQLVACCAAIRDA